MDDIEPVEVVRLDEEAGRQLARLVELSGDSATSHASEMIKETYEERLEDVSSDVVERVQLAEELLE